MCACVYIQREVLSLKLFTAFKDAFKTNRKELKINYKLEWSQQSIFWKQKEPVNSNDYTGC